MEAASAAYKTALLAGAEEMGIAVEARLADAMTAHYALVVKWAEKMNLTTVTDPVAAAQLHGLDSLLFVPLIAAGAGARVIDVGSGAGFPGIVVALARPELASGMILMEPKRKRASFLRVALAELGLAGVRVVEERLGASPGLAEVIISRATIPPLELVPLAAPHLAVAGTLIMTSGAGAPSEAAIRAAAEAAGLSAVARHIRALPAGETRVLDVIARPRATDVG